MSSRYVIVWEFRIRKEAQQDFVEQYGPQGSWVGLFSSSGSYIKTELVQDVADHHRFLTLDYWESEESYNEFSRLKAAEYRDLDRKLSGLTESETRLGAFRMLQGTENWKGTATGEKPGARG